MLEIFSEFLLLHRKCRQDGFRLIITKSNAGSEEICLNDVRSFLIWWKDYFPKNTVKFAKVAAVQFGEYELFVSVDSKLHIYSKSF